MKEISLLSNKKPIHVAIFVFIFSLTIAYYFSSNIKEEIVKNSNNAVLAKSEKISVYLQEVINRSVFDLYTLQSFYNTHQDIDYSQFSQFTRLLLKDIDYIRALEWIPKVDKASRTQFVETQKKEFGNFYIKELMSNKTLRLSSAKSEYFPVNFIQPLIGNENALGLDLGSNKSRRQTLEYARDSAEITATEQISLVQDKASSKDFLMVAPVYENGITPSTLVLRQNNLKGFVLGVFQINSLIKRVSSQAKDEGLILTLVDLDSDKSPFLFGQNLAEDFAFEILVPQRAWQLQFTMTDKLRNQVFSPPIYNWSLFMGFIISILLALSAYALVRISHDSRQVKRLNLSIKDHNQNLEVKVHERTQSLAMKNEELNNNVTQLTQSREALSRLMQELKKQKDDAEQKSIELTRSNKELDEFAYVASHDLKAPLRGIDQLASWIEEDLQSNDMDEVPEHLASIRQRISRLEKLLIDLLEYSKVGRHEEKISAVDSKKLIEDVFMLNAPSNSCQLSFKNHFPEKLAVTAQFELIIRNLIGNAIKHCNNENLLLELDCTEQADTYTFSIKDNGPGIDSKHFDQIFQMFKTLKPRDKVEGSGMGLALIKKVVNNYGCNIHVESKLGQGTTFFFDWPKTLASD